MATAPKWYPWCRNVICCVAATEAIVVAAGWYVTGREDLIYASISGFGLALCCGMDWLRERRAEQ